MPAHSLKGPFVGRGRDSRNRRPYHPVPGLVTAANTALLLEAPLLLAGEAGCGKTDFAWAAATALSAALGENASDHAEPLQCYVRSDTRARDLLYRYDSLRRFADAQAGERALARDPRNYLDLEGLGLALMAPGRRVVLIDEIDKAPRDLPNDLLRELDQGHFEIPEILDSETHIVPGTRAGQEGIGLARHMWRPKRPRPLIVVTSNAERQLPDAFLRRCVFYYIEYPSQEDLGRIIKAHFGAAPLAEGPLGAALDLYYCLRERLEQGKKPATAELLAWLTALPELGSRALTESLQVAIKALRDQGALVQQQWDDLLLGCLVKQKEDWDLLRGTASG